LGLLKFQVYPPTGPAEAFSLRGAHLVGADSVPVRGDIAVTGDLLTCAPRKDEPVGLSLLWPVADCGLIQLETTRLLPRERSYVLNVELARQRLMRISVKREEWGLFDYPNMESIAADIDAAQAKFIECLQQLDNPPKAARLADQALAMACKASEDLCRFHAGVFLARRGNANGFARPFLGVGHGLARPEALQSKLAEVFDFVRMPFVWRQLQVDEQTVQLDRADAAVKAALKARLGVRGGPLLNFGVQAVPDWLYIYENDFEAISNYAREHVRRIVRRYGGKIQSWVACSGLHADSAFPFTIEHMVELTRMATGAVRQLDPRAQVVVDLVQPWGEYYARNPQTAPPMLYAEVLVQAGVAFDAFGLQVVFGIDSDGYHARDMLQISSMIDRLANFGKPIQITAAVVPSRAGARGAWHTRWSDKVQAEWLIEFARIALSRPYVESVTWAGLLDVDVPGIDGGGLLHDDLKPRPAFQQLQALRQQLLTKVRA
jgi:GH35 family endo-1,4-beta-xylanase